MNKSIDKINIPTQEEFCKGIEEFEKREKRDAMYKVAIFIISHYWGKPFDMANGLGVLLLTWNQAFYRYGIFDFDKLERCIDTNLKELKNFRNRHITGLLESDEKDITALFKEFLEALQIDSGKMQGRTSPVAVSKALHILAPDFFPIWDQKIAKAYGYNYYKKPEKKYFSFCRFIKNVADKVEDYVVHSDKTLVKLIDEYNFSKYTGGWI